MWKTTGMRAMKPTQASTDLRRKLVSALLCRWITSGRARTSSPRNSAKPTAKEVAFCTAEPSRCVAT